MILLLSYGSKHGKAPKADHVWSAQHLRNPFSVARLRPLTGQHPEVQSYVAQGAATQALVEAITHEVWRDYQADPRAAITVAVGCMGGKHRSVVVVELVAVLLREKGLQPIVGHRDIGRE